MSQNSLPSWWSSPLNHLTLADGEQPGGVRGIRSPKFERSVVRKRLYLTDCNHTHRRMLITGAKGDDQGAEPTVQLNKVGPQADAARSPAKSPARSPAKSSRKSPAPSPGRKSKLIAAAATGPARRTAAGRLQRCCCVRCALFDVAAALTGPGLDGMEPAEPYTTHIHTPITGSLGGGSAASFGDWKPSASKGAPPTGEDQR